MEKTKQWCQKSFDVGMKIVIMTSGIVLNWCFSRFLTTLSGKMILFNQTKITQQPYRLIFDAPPWRCKLWIRNCNNLELSKILYDNSKRIDSTRICQKHFLKEFFAPPSRLLRHAIPVPHGVNPDQIDFSSFMSECAGLMQLYQSKPTDAESPRKTYRKYKK